MMAWHRLRWCFRLLKSKSGRMIIMLILTVGIAVAEIVYGIRTKSQLLIADGLFSFAEGIALVGSLVALRYAKAQRLHAKNTFGWARLELLAGLLQEVLLLSLSLSITIDAINKLINPTHIEDPSAMIYLGFAGACIGLLGLFLFHGYHHDHNIGDEIVEQKKNDFVQSVCDTLRNLDSNQEKNSNEQSNTLLRSEVVINETSLTVNEGDRSKQRLVLPSLNDTYTNVFRTAERAQSDEHGKQLRVPNRIRTRSGESISYSTLALNDDKPELEDDFQESRAVLLESAIVLCSGLLNKFIPHIDQSTHQPINIWLKYIDPALTLVMVIIIAIKAIPVVWSLGHILVEAVPSGIDTQHLIQTIMKTIPQIRAVHSVHVWRATARDVFATLHVVCNEDLSLSTCTEIFGRQLQRVFETHCIRHFTLQFEYIQSGENIHKCAYGARRRHRGHQSSSEDNENIIQSQIDIRVNSNHVVLQPIGRFV
ncbi:unnamed protein product [Adineta ricciae]|uniref:Zinc transporter 1 n=1 Tax=Adineta ricciae TaxID=249248 RepID=A0A813VJ35_ADIRI|nr:unnamed protein product [Adineta ricciae]